MSDFNPAYRGFVSYIDKSREFYLNKGHNNPYRWAAHPDVPFTKLTRPLAQSRIGVITTAAPDEEGGINRRVYSASTQAVPSTIHTHHVSWHKTATHTRDMGTYLPLQHLTNFVHQGRIESLSPRFYGVPTKFSQRQTKTEDGPAILKMFREDSVDIALLIPL